MSDEVPSGYRLEQCGDLRGKGNRGLALRLLVPDGYQAESRTGTGCGFSADLDRGFWVTTDVPDALRLEVRDLKRFEGAGGDDGVEDVVYRAGAARIGTLRADLLTVRPNNDGLPEQVRTSQARGVRLQWSVPDGQDAEHVASWWRVSGGVALVRDDRSTCRTGAGSVWFVAPVPQTESIDHSGGDGCHLYLRPGRESLLRYAEVVPHERRSLRAEAARLRANPRVGDVLLEPGAGLLGGRQADRLTWTVTRAKPNENGEPAGTWRAVAVSTGGVRATWSATPEQWRTERGVAQRFFDSVRPLR